MRRLLQCFVLVMLMAVSPAASAQRPAFYKMSALVREACRDASTATNHSLPFARGRRLSPSQKASATIIAFVKLADSDTAPLQQCGARVLAQYGSLCVAEIPLQSLSRLSLSPKVNRIEAGRRATALMDTTAIIVDATPAWEGIDLPQGYTGKGVVVGVQDIGFDLTHPNFWTADMSAYRIKALWDQISTDTLDTTLPAGRDYEGQETLLALGHPRDGLIQTHGTHTAGIAAGSGAEGGGVQSPYRGIAYDADLCLVCNATGDDAELLDPKDYYKYTYALDALGFKYMFDYADRVGKPCVINFSEGSRESFHGDDVLMAAMLDSLSGPGHIIVASAGNEGNNLNYVHKAATDSTAGIFFVSADASATATTRSTSADFTMEFRSYYTTPATVVAIPFSAVLEQPDSTYRDTLTVGSRRYFTEVSAFQSCYDDGRLMCDWTIEADSLTRTVGYRTALRLVGTGSDVELFPSTGYFMHRNYDATMNAGDNTHSILTPSSAPSVISVGATAWRDHVTNYLGDIRSDFQGLGGVKASFSSVGPTLDGHIKPDVVAPGQFIISSYSSYYLENKPDASDIASDVRHFTYNGRTYAWNANGGTSMSAPVVAGVIALWLQANPKLTTAQVLDVFSHTCRRPDASLSYPNNLYGYGEIDAAAGLRYIVEQTTGISDVHATKPHDDRIYTLDGRYAGRDLSRLPQGIYITAGRKIVVP